MNNMEERKKQISELVKEYYCKHKYLRNEALDILINKALDKFLTTDLTIEEIRRELDKIVDEMLKKQYSVYMDNNTNDTGDDIKKNHNDIYDRLDELVYLLNENNIDYQLAGSLCGYLKYGEESDRRHDDIDISINENDLDKFKEICKSLGLSYIDDRNNPRKQMQDGKITGNEEVEAIDIRDGFRIDLLTFKRLENGDVVSKEYYYDEDKNLMCKEEMFEKELADLLYGKEAIAFRGNQLLITPPEYVYSFKKYTDKEKDIDDVKYLDSRIDFDKLRKITELLSSKKINDVVIKGNENSKKNEDVQEETEKNNELDNMMNDINDEKTVSDENLYEKPKSLQFQKNEDGFASNLTIANMFVTTAVIIVLGLIALIFIIK